MPSIVRSASAVLPDGLPDKEAVVIGDPVMVEVLPALRGNREFRIAQTVLEALIFQPMVGRANALASTRSYRTLRAAGTTARDTTGRLIATCCLHTP